MENNVRFCYRIKINVILNNTETKKHNVFISLSVLFGKDKHCFQQIVFNIINFFHLPTDEILFAHCYSFGIVKNGHFENSVTILDVFTALSILDRFSG